MDRRAFLAGAAALGLPWPGRAFAQQVDVDTLVAGVGAEIERRRAGKKPIPASWIAGQLGEGLGPRERRIAAFKVVQDIPYKLTTWTGDPDSLFSLGRGDCRHKANGLLRLLKVWKMEARPIQVLFDWASLPIPAEIMSNLVETRGVHDSVEVKIDGKFVLMDPTWDRPLGSVGFPVLSKWDGVSPTLPIAPNANVILRPGDLKPGTNVFAYFGLKPERKRTLAFNKAFNAWSDEVRAGQKLVKG